MPVPSAPIQKSLRLRSASPESLPVLLQDPHKYRVPVPPQIKLGSIIHGAMDNFDDGPSNDAILMLFQNILTESKSKSVT